MNHQTYLFVGLPLYSSAKQEIEQIMPEIKEVRSSNIYFISKKEDKKTIGIKEISEVAEINALKSENLRLIIIENAHLLTDAAQNGLLKTVEESNPNTLIILLSKNIDSILQTIRSRCRIITLRNTIEKSALVAEFIEVNDIVSGEALIAKIAKEDSGRDIVRDIISKLLEKHKDMLISGNTNQNSDMLELLIDASKGVNNSISIKLLLETLLINILLR